MPRYEEKMFLQIRPVNWYEAAGYLAKIQHPCLMATLILMTWWTAMNLKGDGDKQMA